MGKRNVLLVCGGKYHDIDFARKELLNLLYEQADIRTRVVEDYSDIEAINNADIIVSYTCDVRPSPDSTKALGDFVRAGKKWFALHGTNSIIRFNEDGMVESPRENPELMKILGSQFIAHPPIQRFHVTNEAPDHPLVAGISAFDVEDELYLSEFHGERTDLLTTRYTGKAEEGFVEDDWPDDAPRSVMYLHPFEGGEVLYLTLGHARAKYDLQPLMDEYPYIERCAWQHPTYYELLRRGIRWSLGEYDQVPANQAA